MPVRTFGFLAARLDDPYQHAVWNGAADAARQWGGTIVFFGGQRLKSPIGFEALDNIAFDVAERSNLSALAVMTNVIATYISQQELLRFLSHFKGKPVISIGVNLPGIPSVCIDNRGPMEELADHLVKVHNRRRFLFLAGPARHPESMARQKEFIQKINKLLGPEGQVQVEYCNFQEDEASHTIATIFSQSVPFDAVVAANDQMALGALKTLSELGISVPEQVSVTGFDDTEDSRFSIPPLTTVRQKAYELGFQAINQLAIALDTEQAPQTVMLPGVCCIYRESCGCRSPHLTAIDVPDEHLFKGTMPDPLERLVHEVNATLAQGKNPAGIGHYHLTPGQQERARVIVADGIARYQANLRRSVERRTAVLQEIEASLVASFSLPDILAEIGRGIQTLGISACWLVVFASSEPRPVWGRLLLAATGDRIRILAPRGLRFRIADIIPGGLPYRWASYVCEPLRFGKERLGYFICTGDSEDRRVFDALRDQISSALKGALLMASERNREEELEQEVRLRTIELSRANKRLIEEIERRRALEQELLAISHEIMGRIGRDIHDDLCQNIAGIGLMAAILEGNLRRLGSAAGEEAARAASEIAEEASRTARHAKYIARGLYPVDLEDRGFIEAIQELIHAAQARSQATIQFHVEGCFSIKKSDVALHLYRIIQEALNNAITHAKASNITVSLRKIRETALIEITDDGIGFSLPSSSGMGLRIMKYRASVIGAELDIQSSEKGTSVICRMGR
ncbi:MAG TPA: substrate-binding domain-containing protein [Termitinemataceae bacterium]|nr:substrate-binding domain-containing protein [Termitinemataceae bacterium]HOM23496.1 substrate-binding domain-containing protein [Termitinemataceae bacterium]HPP99989.1 substrate-binding domain-containing protein [Termitinemataceae bacterium]